MVRDRQFFIGRYVDILRKKGYHRVEEYALYGECLWSKLKTLPMGYCHGDVYCGNLRRAEGGKLYMLDFDTSCKGFPMYDATLICDATEYFRYDEENLARSDRLLERFLPEYGRYSHFTQAEIGAFHALIAMQHFSTQATIVELFGPDCLRDEDIDGQLEWLYRWREQCKLCE
ncbi:phosphotransferase [Acutalibacter caecimuris]|uniref:phosphotransferase n=1 Tax=Acutalibacter caecimuris TaxID=3093657 RepID=UPI002AC95241|nr:phosphotransferase [Acutalibacter sp. M00118]